MSGEPEIDLNSLGTFDGDGAPAPEPEPTPEPGDEPTPKAEATPAAEPAKEPAPAAAAAAEPEDDFEELTLEELDSRIKGNLRAAIKELRDEERAEGAEPDDTDVSDEVKELRAKVAGLEAEKAKIEAERKAEADQSEQRHLEAVTADLNKQMESAARKYTMTAEEVDAVVAYALDNPDLAKAWPFEKLALRLMPELQDRTKTPPAAAQDAPRGGSRASGVLVGPTASGAGAPRAFKHTPSPGDYSDITRHTLQSGEAAALGKYE